MTKGRKPIPTALKKLRGTDQPCRINENELKLEPVSKLPSAPRWFSPTAKKIYRTKGEQLRALGLLTVLDFELFISFCREYANYIDTSKELDKIPMLAFMNEKNEQVNKRLMKLNKESWERAKALASEFGFSPSARTKLVLPENEDNNNEDFS